MNNFWTFNPLDQVQNVEVDVPGKRVQVTTTASKDTIQTALAKTGKAVAAL